jgi:dTDP-4-dehydrorhamnose reductase
MIQLEPFPQGLFHLAAQGYTSRYEMARFIFDSLGLDVNIAPCKTSDYPSKAARPLNSRFDCGKLHSLLGVKMRPWQKPLVEFLERI